ncbi:MAG: site-specific DNA-methyltransferase [Kiritimatiellae bacterium]|nr:site-specific DNA-methyltransferase [Kiritimatiellia bacterium]
MLDSSRVDLVVCGDALVELEALPSGSMNLVYLDPPFFSQKSHGLTSRETGQKYSFDDRFDTLEDYLALLVPVLREARRVLSEDGSIFLHCDRYASHHLREEMDKVFGVENFQSEIIWTYRRWSNSKKGLLNSHQNIYFYSKSDAFKFNQFFTDYSPATNIDQILQERARNALGRCSYKRNEAGEVVLAKEKKGVPLSDVWNIPYLNPKAKERCGYPTQKPVALLQRIIELVTDKGDVVVDPFCGSGTTCVAAKSLSRHFYGIDKSEDAVLLARKRLDEMVISESQVLASGIESFSEKDELENSILASLNAIPVQRNKGIDGFIRRDGCLIPVKIQKENETIDDAIVLIEHASRGKAFVAKIVIQTNSRHNLFNPGEFLGDTDVKVIPYLGLQIEDALKPLEQSRVAK